MKATDNFKISSYVAGDIVVLIMTLLFRPFAIVNAGERSVFIQFSKIQDNVLDKDVYLIMPIVTSVERLSVRIQ